jgi:hypothetical protein
MKNKQKEWHPATKPLKTFYVCYRGVSQGAQHSYIVGLYNPNEFIYRYRREIGWGWGAVWAGGNKEMSSISADQ